MLDASRVAGRLARRRAALAAALDAVPDGVSFAQVGNDYLSIEEAARRLADTEVLLRMAKHRESSLAASHTRHRRTAATRADSTPMYSHTPRSQPTPTPTGEKAPTETMFHLVVDPD